jgi:hypothetical protein
MGIDLSSDHAPTGKNPLALASFRTILALDHSFVALVAGDPDLAKTKTTCIMGWLVVHSVTGCHAADLYNCRTYIHCLHVLFFIRLFSHPGPAATKKILAFYSVGNAYGNDQPFLHGIFFAYAPAATSHDMAFLPTKEHQFSAASDPDHKSLVALFCPFYRRLGLEDCFLSIPDPQLSISISQPPQT